MGRRAGGVLAGHSRMSKFQMEFSSVEELLAFESRRR